MLPNKRRLPPVRKKNNDDDINKEEIKQNEEELKKIDNNNERMNIPEFLKMADNQQTLQTFMRMRQRNIQDGAIKLSVEPDDIANDNADLYENKCINLEQPIINEKLAKNVEFYIESFKKNKYFLISKEGINQMKKIKTVKKEEKILMNEKDILKSTKLDLRDKKNIEFFQKATEEEMFKKFDLELKYHIKNLSIKITFLFLIAGGLLAGASLLNILLLLQYLDYNTFINSYSYSAREIFNFIHSFTFCTLTGNGLKFLSAYKRYSLSTFDENNVYNLKRSMLFSGVVVFLSSVIFAIMLYLSSYIPLINYTKYSTKQLIENDSFVLFATLFTVCNIISILIFILNIFDLDVLRENEIIKQEDVAVDLE